MISQRALRRKRHLRDEEGSSQRPTKPRRDHVMMTLQRQIGNQAIQQMLAQRQAAEQAKQDEATAKLPVDAGQIKVEKPEIEEYEVSGNSLAEISEQVLPPEEWYEYEYQYNPKVENGVITQIDVVVMTKIRLPRWVGAGWDNASEVDKLAWLQMVGALVGGEDEEYDDMGQLPQQWVGVNWEEAPEALKAEWRGMLQEMQSDEQRRLDMILRRMLVFQQRMLNQPENQVNTVVDQFLKDVEVEEEGYNKQREFGQIQHIVLNPDNLVK